MNRQKLALFLLLIALACALAYSFWRSPRARHVAALTYRPGATAPAPRKAAAANPVEGRVHLELLDRELPHFAGYRRDLFTPLFHEEVKLPPIKALPPPPKPVRLPPPPAQPAAALAPAPPTPEQLAAAELARFTFLGFLQKNGEKTVFFSNNNEIFLAKKGEKLGDKFLVTGISDDALTLKPLAGGSEMAIPLVENRSLSVRRTSKP